MKKKLLLLVCLAICLSGCVSQLDYDSVNSQIVSFQEELSAKDDEISSLKSANDDYENKNKDLSDAIEQLNNDKSTLEKQVADLTSKVDDLTSKIDELENGAINLLYKVRAEYENGKYDNAINTAKELHSKFNGSSEDDEAQKISQDAQAKLDEIEQEKKRKEELEAAERAKTKEQKVHDIMRVYDLSIYKIDSAGGVEVSIAWVNNSDKEIKYIWFSVVPYNAVGDIVYSEIGGGATARLKVTGPYAPGTGEAHYFDSIGWCGSMWSSVWYNYTAKTLKFTEIQIEYMDGSSTVIKGDDLQYVIY